MNPVIMKNLMVHIFGTKTKRIPKVKPLLHTSSTSPNTSTKSRTSPPGSPSGPLLDDAALRARAYLPAGAMPERLIVDLSVATPSITWHPEGVIILDMGLALAAGPEQLEDIIAANLLRSLSPTAGVKPYEAANGAEALKAAFRKLHHESMVNWVEDYLNLELDISHPTFGQLSDKSRLRAVTDAELILTRMGEMLDTLLDPTSGTLDSTGGSIDDLLRLGKRYQPVGYAMAALCVDVFGEARFQAAALQGTLAWLELYQEAATSGRGSGDLGLLPPFSDDNMNALRTLLGR